MLLLTLALFSNSRNDETRDTHAPAGDCFGFECLLLTLAFFPNSRNDETRAPGEQDNRRSFREAFVFFESFVVKKKSRATRARQLRTLW
jgi:hypothetical protein